VHRAWSTARFLRANLPRRPCQPDRGRVRSRRERRRRPASARRSGRVHRRRPGPHQLVGVPRERARAAGPADRRGPDAAVVVAFPDCFTRLGGNQYVNSASMGAWADFLVGEMLPAVEGAFGCGGAGRRGVFGKSSGGLWIDRPCLDHSDVWAAAACHSGDMAFELCYLPDMPTSCARSPRARGRSRPGDQVSKRRPSRRTGR